MKRNELKKRLDNLYDDLNNSNDEILKKYYLFDMSKNDREEYFRKIYIDECLPTRVMNYDRDRIDKDFDYDVFDRFISSIDEYIVAQEEELNKIIANHQNAVILFREVINLPSPMSDILYLSYFKQMSTKEIMSKLYMSRPTYFRTKRAAITLLLSKITFD